MAFTPVLQDELIQEDQGLSAEDTGFQQGDLQSSVTKKRQADSSLTGETNVFQKLERGLARIASGSAPFLTGGLVSTKEAQQDTGLGPAESGIEKTLQGLGTAAGIGGQAFGAIKGVSTAAKLAGAGKIGTALGAGGITTGAAEGALVGAAQPGTISERAESAATGAALGGLFTGAIQGTGPLLKAGKDFVRGTFGKITGAGEAALSEAFANPNVIKVARQAGITGVDDFQRAAVTQAKTGLQSLRNTRRQEYLGQLSKIRENPKALTSSKKALDDELGKLLSTSAKGGFDISLGKKGVPNFAKSTITEGENVVTKAINDIRTWDDLSSVGLDTLKKRLDDFASQAKRGTPAHALVSRLRGTIDTQLKKNVPGYSKMTKGYREATELIEEVEGGLSLGPNARLDTTINKLMSTMRQNNEMKLGLLREVSKAGGQDIVEKIAGTQLAPLLPRGLAGSLEGITAAGVAIANPSSLPLAMTALASASPRVIGEFATALGTGSRFIGQANPKTLLQAVNPKLAQEISDFAIKGARAAPSLGVASTLAPEEKKQKRTIQKKKNKSGFTPIQ